jgi:thiol-disulfide isomerase/thioredoxin
VRAPALRGRRWLNTGGREIGPEQLRGRIVLLDFWTAGCVNCLRVLDELAVLEQRHGDALVVLGVHSPKFPHEAQPEAVAAAVRRHDVRHPVLDDADLVTWDAYAVHSWPTLVLVDPRGYVVAQMTGEAATPPGSPSRSGSRSCRPRSPTPSATTWWWPTPVTTRCAGCAWPTAR